jgi:hypothetical protein
MLTTEKEVLLYKYSRQDPQLFYRFDGVANVPEAYSGFADEDGQVVCASLSSELVAGSTVRLLIKEGADRQSVLAMLDKIRDWIAMDVTSLTPEKYQEQAPIVLSQERPKISAPNPGRSRNRHKKR